MPLLSVCIPTYNRADLLDFCLERLRELKAAGIEFEVVVSDNASTDATADIVRKHAGSLRMVYRYQPEKCEPLHGFVNAVRNASGRYVVYLGDDDALLSAPLAAYLRRLEDDPGLVAIFADWVAFDDAQGREMHRYFQFADEVSFGPGDSLAYANFLLANVVYTEMGIMRREALLRSDCMGKRIHQSFYRWAYLLTRLGRVALTLEPFYRENRVVQQRFQRGLTDNMRLRLQAIGDEMRQELEVILLWALQDAGAAQVPEDQQLRARQLIDRYLNSRIELEVQRAIAEKNWILALDLRRRHVLWYGAGGAELARRDAVEISLPAALQAVRDAYHNLSDVGALRLAGFESAWVGDFLRNAFPEITLLPQGALPPTGKRLLVLERQSTSAAQSDGYRFWLDVLLKQYSVTNAPLDLAGL